MPHRAPAILVAILWLALGLCLCGDAAAGSPAAGPSDEQFAEWLRRARPTVEERVELRRRYVEERLVALPRPADLPAWRRERESLRQRLVDSLGLRAFWPTRGDVVSRVVETLPRDGYRIEKLWFEGHPGQPVSALLYLPDGVAGRAPGIVSLAGHVYGLGKAAEFLQQRNVNLVRRGCVVLTYDYLGCGERNTGPDPFHDQPYGGGNDHGIRSFSYTLRNPTGLEVLDALRAVDLLVGRDDVDPERIGFTGESGGGNTTYWVSALDERIRLSAPVACLTTYDYWIRHDRNWDWHQRPYGVRAYANVGTLLAMHAPAPLLAISSRRGTDDHEFPLEEADASVAWARTVYGLYEKPDALSHHESTTPHGYQEDKRRLLYRAVERFLDPPRPQGDEELPTRIETFDALRVGLPREGLTNLQLYTSWTRGLPKRLADEGMNEEETERAARDYLLGRLGWPAVHAPPKEREVAAEKTDEAEFAGGRVEWWRIETEPGVACPALLLWPKEPPSAVSLVPDQRADAARGELSAGRAVLVFTPRGAFEEDDGGRAFRNFAWLFGRPVAGQRAYDLARAGGWLKQRWPDKRVRLVAAGQVAWHALLAAAAEPTWFDDGELELPFQSQHDALRRHGGSSLADVPGLLERLDVEELARLWPRGTVRRPGK